jgi:hypothetical protein
MEFWDKLTLPTQDTYDDIEYVNPAEAYKRQVNAINLSSPLYAELELVSAWLGRAKRIEREITRRVLAQEMSNLKGTQTRTNDLVDAFILSASADFQIGNKIKDIRPFLIKLRRKIDRLEVSKEKLERRLKAIEKMADRCDIILNWNKHEAKLELQRKYS